ncbi:unnamed protein product [Adineta steineri]|uniref:F-box domain-containing protein n=1 Tax=Adineta steineri TaxID=433720 RepID=A0A815YD07_9BILA|nr:unnamed protein product [Adineta steineri]
MTEYNRKSSFNNQKKNFNQKTEGKISSLNCLSNEIFYEIFNYLESCEVYYAFNNLNHRFEQLLKSLSIMLNINSDNLQSKKYIPNILKRILNFNQGQIIVIYLDMSLSIKEYVSFDSSFNRLHSLYLHNCQSDILIPFLTNLSCLSSLSSLTLDSSDQSIDLTDIYQIILTLPALKKYTLLANGPTFSSLLPVANINQKLSTIEQLDIRNHCNFNDCLSIMSYTPKLSHLIYIQPNPIDFNIEINSSISPSKLTHLYIRVSDMKFDIFEKFISKIPSKLKVLSFTTESEDINYLDANRWKRFLLKYYPQLEEFYLRYHTTHHDNFDSEKRNKFLSLFWIERRWIFEVKMGYKHILYSIKPYKNRWYDVLPNGIFPSSSILKKSSHLTLMNIHSKQWRNIKYILTLTQIHHLAIPVEKIFIGTLMVIVNSLPELVSLQLHSLSFEQPDDIDDEDFYGFFKKQSTSKIKKVYVEKIDHKGEIAFLSTLCPLMECCRIISFENSTDMKSYYL